MVLYILRLHLFEQLAAVERHIVQGELNISAQRSRVAALEQSGADAAFSRGLLANFEAALSMHNEHRGRILRELAE